MKSAGWLHDRDTPCSSCQHFGGFLPKTTSTAYCNDPRGVHVRSQAEYGCAFWRLAEPGDPRPEPPPNWGDGVGH